MIKKYWILYFLIPVLNKKADSINKALKKYRDCHPYFNDVFKSITFANGIEFSKWREMEGELNIKTYFGRPYHSCDRGSNENCNSMIRRYIKKGTAINTIDRYETLRINKAINTKLRKIMNWSSASDEFYLELSKCNIKMTTDIYRLY